MLRGSISLLALVCAAIAAADPPAELPAVDAMPPRLSSAERLTQIAQRVQAAAIYPPIARARGVSGETTVVFEIERSGAPQEIRIRRSSGSPTLDRAAERAVTAAAPLPWVYGEVTVPVLFVLRDAE